MNVLVFGGSGLVGSAFRAAAPTDWVIRAPSSSECDIATQSAVDSVVDGVRPSLILNAAAYTNVDGAEDHQDLAYQLNAVAPGYIAAAATRVGARLIHLSSDYVFDGTATVPYAEDAPTNPLSVYGKSKLGGEQAVFAAMPEALVVRSQWIFGYGGRTLVNAMQGRALRGEKARVVSDQRGRPTFASDLAAVLVSVGLRTDIHGHLHIANDDASTSYELAAAVYAFYGAGGLVTPVSAKEYGARALRPGYSPLSLGRLRTLGFSMRPWLAALHEYLITSRG